MKWRAAFETSIVALRDCQMQLDEMIYIAVTGIGLEEVRNNHWYQQIAKKEEFRRSGKKPLELAAPSVFASKIKDA